MNRKSFLWESCGNVRLNKAAQVCVEGGAMEYWYPREVCRLLGEAEICCLRGLSLAQAGSVRLESVYRSGASQLEYGHSAFIYSPIQRIITSHSSHLHIDYDTPGALLIW